MAKRFIIGAGVALGAVMAWGGPAAATHTHVRVLDSGDCVVIAANGAENEVDLSGTGVFEHNPNVAVAPAADRNHPLHVLVHRGRAGEVQRIEVMGSAGDPCWGPSATGEYVNAQP
ncbi:MAG: hypothetical protein ACRD03_07715 [Acidimicrobiales bacterium]